MNDPSQTREPQYSLLLDVKRKFGDSKLGIMANESWNNDPRRTLFTLARYKFVSKMLAGKKSALEIGCGDAFATRLVQQTVEEVTAIDFDPVFIDDIKRRESLRWPLRYFLHDILSAPAPGGPYESAFTLDVLEHISPSSADVFVRNIVRSLSSDGILVVGMPSLESQTYASPQSRAGHVNCMSGTVLKHFLEGHFDQVFMFSMNDEVVHTGFFPMAHYLFALCVTPK